MIFMPMIDEKFKLEKLIESLREEMIRIGIKEGLNSEKTIEISQKLDRYISKYQFLRN
ncbi:aspartyl-phosphate phosphatase Spo0E family protein [Bacillus sp. EB600]|uniref:aspartyl-phosphate phosphatase Spo0E family protein n=1 Tax=Bacillus sp. EB600 TaxID=2806345 RepID=UPI00210B5F7C|nr:aspartyl-phosphate phosphatase Spo0E family protein [Bacillus sp. EB600]